MAQVTADLALVVLLEPQAQANEAALLQRRQITKVTSDVVGIQLVCGAKVSKEQGQLVEETKHTVKIHLRHQVLNTHTGNGRETTV